MKALRGTNLALMFFLEMGVYAGVVLWAVRADAHVATRAALAVGGVLLLAVLWGLFAAPRGPHSGRAIPA